MPTSGHQQPGVAQTPSWQLLLTHAASAAQGCPSRAGATQVPVPPEGAAQRRPGAQRPVGHGCPEVGSAVHAPIPGVLPIMQN